MQQFQGQACARALQQRSGASGSAEFFPLDVTSAGDRARLATYMEAHPALGHEKEGVPDLVINNAGVCIRQDSAGAYEASLAVNTWGPVRLLTEACLPRMRRRGYAITSEEMGE